jgi:hypothetical protein
MSFKEWMQEVHSPEELRILIGHLIADGSPNWTLESASRYVAPSLLVELTRYFDESGQLRWPAEGEAEETGRDATAMFPGDAAQPGARTLSELIASFHSRLALARAVPAPGTRSMERVGGFLEEPLPDTKPSAVAVVDTSLEDADGTGSESLFYCAFCERHLDTEPAEYRGVPMCEECVEKIRVRY